MKLTIKNEQNEINEQMIKTHSMNGVKWIADERSSKKGGWKIFQSDAFVYQ
jgi:hypothetical protein